HAVGRHDRHVRPGCEQAVDLRGADRTRANHDDLAPGQLEERREESVGHARAPRPLENPGEERGGRAPPAPTPDAPIADRSTSPRSANVVRMRSTLSSIVSRSLRTITSGFGVASYGYW